MKSILFLFLTGAVCAAVPLSFEANVGQFKSEVRFAARVGGHRAWLTPTAISVGDMRMAIVNATPDAPFTGGEALPGRANYFFARESWRNVPTFAQVWVAGVYPGIDLMYYGKEHRLEYDFIVAPGIDPSQIRLAFENAEAITLDAAGNLTVKTDAGSWTWRKPRVAAGQCGYKLHDDCSVSFQVDGYDASQPLIIDPELVFATYLGGNGADSIRAMARDSAGNIYLAGATQSVDFPGTNTLPSLAHTQGPYYGTDVLVTKVSPDGTELLYTAYFGGNGEDGAWAIAVDANGGVAIAGTTTSLDFPVTNAIQSTYGDIPHIYYPDGDAFVAKLAPDAQSLEFATYLGGQGEDAAYGIAIDQFGAVYVTGSTISTNFPVVNALQPEKILGSDSLDNVWSSDAFVAKLSPNGATLEYSTHWGDDGFDVGRGIAVDRTGNVYVTGSTGSTNFPVLHNAFQPKQQGGEFANILRRFAGDAFVTKFDATGTNVLFSTYLGRDGPEEVNGIALDDSGNVYITGVSASSNFPAVNLRPTNPWYQGECGAYIAKIASDGSKLLAGNCLGAGTGNSLVVDSNGVVSVVGVSNDPDWPPVVPNPSNCGGGVLASKSAGTFVARLIPGATNVIYCVRLPHSSGTSVALADDGDVLIAGDSSGDLAVTNAIQPVFAGWGDGFLARIRPDTAPVFRLPIRFTPNPIRLDYPAFFSTAACDPDNDSLSVWWIFDGTILSGSVASYSFASLGTNFVQVFASDGLLTNSMTTNVDVRANTAAGTITFSERWSRGPVKVNIGAEHYTQVLDLGRYTITATLSLAAVDTTQLNTDTTFRIAIGSFDFSGKLGDDPFYLPGKTDMAVVYRAGPVITGEKPYTWLAYSLHWDAQQLTIDLHGIPSAIDASVYYGPIVGNLFYGQSSGKTNGATGAVLEFDRALAIIDVPFAAKVKTRMPKKNGTIRTQVKATGAGSASQ